MIKYRTNSDTIHIVPVEAERETEKFVWVKNELYRDFKRIAKKTEHERYHDTWKDAHDFIWQRERERRRKYYQKWFSSIKALELISTMKEPEGDEK